MAGQFLNPEWVELNSGIIVIEPSKEMHQELLALIPETIEKQRSKGLGFGDQDVFHEWFPEWKNHEELHLDEKYNMFFFDANQYYRQKPFPYKDLSVIHFIGEKKPWMKSFHYMRTLLSLIKSFRFLTLYFCSNIGSNASEANHVSEGNAIRICYQFLKLE